MNFATDRDLLHLDPLVFREFTSAAQERLRVNDAAVNAAGTTLTSTLADFAATQIGTGNIALLNDQPIEIVTRTDANTLTISLVRDQPTDPFIPVLSASNTTNAEFVVHTFTPQISLSHLDLLERIDLAESLTDAVLNPKTAARIEAMETLLHIYAWAYLADGDDDAMSRRSKALAKRFASITRSLTLDLDRNGDGIADDHIDLTQINLTRI